MLIRIFALSFVSFFLSAQPTLAQQLVRHATMPSRAPLPTTGYTITGIGTLPNYQSSSASAINNHREVVGRVCCSTVAGTLYYQAVAFQNGSLTGLGPVNPVAYDGSNGYILSYATAINNNGYIVGQTTYFYFEGSAVCDGWTTGANFTGVTVNVSACGQVVATAVNDLGYVVGNEDAVFNEPQGVFSSYGGQATLFASGPVYVAGINDSGIVVGQDRNGIASLFTLGGTITEIGTLGGSTSFAGAIANSGAIVGGSTISKSSSLQHAFFFFKNKLIDAGTPIGTDPATTSSSAAAVNNLNEFVGSYSPPSGGSRAFVDDGTTMRDLTSLIVANPGWTLSSASGINDCGDIVGTGTINGQTYGYLAQPIRSYGPEQLRLGCRFGP